MVWFPSQFLKYALCLTQNSGPRLLLSELAPQRRKRRLIRSPDYGRVWLPEGFWICTNVRHPRQDVSSDRCGHLRCRGCLPLRAAFLPGVAQASAHPGLISSRQLLQGAPQMSENQSLNFLWKHAFGILYFTVDDLYNIAITLRELFILCSSQRTY